MVLLNINYIRELYISIILILFLLDSTILCDDDDDLEKIYRLRKRLKRDFSIDQQQQHQSSLPSSFGRLCPMQCSCSFDTLYCNDLIETCDECVYWTQIEFSRVTNLNEKSFKNYKFAENKTTNIVYKLADGNGTIDENSFKDFYVPQNSQIQITFHYNPVINFNKNALNGIYFDNNSTLVFNFPYTTQIVFNTQFFQTLTMNGKDAKLIIRVFKSFIVRFTSDNNNNNNNNNDDSIERTYQQSQLNSRKNNWNINNGQFIIDVKSTHLVKFEENCFYNLKLNNAKFYVDLEFIEKLMFFKNSFNNIVLDDQSQLTVYLKQISYFSLRPYAFNGIKLLKASNLRFFIKELSTRLCFKSNIFNNIYLNGPNTQFNVSLVNSKNLVFLRESFSNVVVDSETAKVNLNIYRLPSVLFNDYNNVVNDERRNYIFPINYHLRSMDYHYNSLSDSLNSEQYDTDNFYIMQKPTYIYNVSMEKQAFFNIALNKQQQYTDNSNLNFIIDNINTLHIDDSLLTPFENERNYGVDKRLNVNFVLNLKNLALNAKSFANCNIVKIKFIEQPARFKLDVSPNVVYTRETFRNMKIEGFNSKSDEDDHQIDVQSSEIKSENKIICDFLSYKNDTTMTIPKSIESCSCALFDQILSNVNNYDIINDINNKNKKPLVPCILHNSNSIKLCKTQVDINCYYVKQISSSGQNNFKVLSQLDSNEYKNVFIKFWQYCSNGKNGSSDQSPSDSTNDFDDNNFFYTSYIYDTDPLLPPSASSYNHLNGSSKEGSRTNIGKIIGIVVVCFICAIILCMIVLNIIQYKFREDQLDETEGNQNADANNIQLWPFKRTISVQSLKRTLSVNSLKRKKEKENRIGTLKSNTGEDALTRNPDTQECCNSDESEDDTRYYEKARERFIVEDELDKTTTRDENSNNGSNKKSICSVDDNYEDNYDESDKFDASSDSSIQQKSPNRQDLSANNDKSTNEKSKLCKQTRLNEDLGYYSRD